MSDENESTLEELKANEARVGEYFKTFCEPYDAIADGLIEFAGELVGDLSEGDPGSQHAVAMILARTISEARAVQHPLGLGYPMQAYTIVGTMLELMHTAAYVGGDDVRAKEYFEHADQRKAYPGGVKKAIEAVGKEAGLPLETVKREYDVFYNQICLVKHGNPMAMSLGTVVDEEGIWLAVGPVLTAASTKLVVATIQQSLRYLLLVLLVYVQHHTPEHRFGPAKVRLDEFAARWEFLNTRAVEFVERLETASGA